MTPKEVQEKLEELGIRAAKIRGQHFLIAQKVLQDIVEAAELKKTDTVLEIGPGLGVLTRELARRAGRVVAIELDHALAEALKKDFCVIEGDVLELDVDKFLGFGNRTVPETGEYKLVANIPYNITSQVIIKFLTEEPSPQLLVLLIQEEVAKKLTAESGKMSRLAVLVQYFGRPEIVRRVGRGAFWPEPKVGSAVLRIRRNPPDVFARREKDFKREDFFQLVQAGFSAPRRKVIGNLSRGLDRPRAEIESVFLKLKISPDLRAERLSLDAWIDIARLLYK